MNTLAFFAAGIVLALIILAKIPGLEHLVRPAIDLIFTGLKAVFANIASWTIWLLKLLLGAHVEFFQHLIFSAEVMDPTLVLRAKSDEA